MRKARIFLFLGTWVAVLPYLGFPYSWKDILATVTGLVLICMSYVLYKESKVKEKKEIKTFDNFRENSDFERKEIESEDGNKVGILEEKPEENLN